MKRGLVLFCIFFSLTACTSVDTRDDVRVLASNNTIIFINMQTTCPHNNKNEGK